MNDVPFDGVSVILSLGLLVPMGLATMALDDDGELARRLGDRFRLLRRREPPRPGLGRRLGAGMVLLAAGIALNDAMQSLGRLQPSSPLVAAGYLVSFALILTAIAADISAIRLARRSRGRSAASNGATVHSSANGPAPEDG